MKQQAKLTTFLARTATTSPAKQLVLVKGAPSTTTTPSSASSPLRSGKPADDHDLPWPEIDLTGGDSSSSSSSSTSSFSSSSTSPYTPTKRKARTSNPKPLESHLPSPVAKRPRTSDPSSSSSSSSSSSTSSSSAPSMQAAATSDSLEDIEEFTSSESQGGGRFGELTDDDLIKAAELAEQQHASTSTTTLRSSSSSSSSSSSTSSSSAAAAPVVHPFFARGGRGKRLGKEFYEHDCETLAKLLLGQLLVRITPDNQRLAGRIVETEAYLGGEDKGAHSYGGKITKKNKSMFEPPGTAYIYKIYVTNHCFNVSSIGEGAAVLVRALEPVEGLVRMRTNRMAGKISGTPVRDTELTSGPGKLCQALELDLVQDGLDLITSDLLWLEEGKQVDEKNIVAGPRINIDYAGEWKDKPLRFHVRGNPHVSKPAFSNNKSPFRGNKKF